MLCILARKLASTLAFSQFLETVHFLFVIWLRSFPLFLACFILFCDVEIFHFLGLLETSPWNLPQSPEVMVLSISTAFLLFLWHHLGPFVLLDWEPWGQGSCLICIFISAFVQWYSCLWSKSVLRCREFGVDVKILNLIHWIHS